MGARTDAARAEVLAARDGLDEELVKLEASGRAAVDIPARVRRDPVKTLGAAGGAAFLLLGGPKRAYRGVRRAIFGPDANLPKSMLPKEVDKTLKQLGTDGDRVRGTLEREFAKYLKEKAPERRDRDFVASATVLLGSLLRPVARRAGVQLAERALDPDGPSFEEAMRRVRERLENLTPSPESTPSPGTTRSPGTAVSARTTPTPGTAPSPTSTAAPGTTPTPATKAAQGTTPSQGTTAAQVATAALKRAGPGPRPAPAAPKATRPPASDQAPH